MPFRDLTGRVERDPVESIDRTLGSRTRKATPESCRERALRRHSKRSVEVAPRINVETDHARPRLICAAPFARGFETGRRRRRCVRRCWQRPGVRVSIIRITDWFEAVSCVEP